MEICSKCGYKFFQGACNCEPEVKPMYMEDVNGLASEIHDAVEEQLISYFEQELTVDQSDKLWNCLQEIIEELAGCPEYKNHN